MSIEEEKYLQDAFDWDAERFARAYRSEKFAKIIAGVAIVVALVAWFAVAALLPFKSYVPFVVKVDNVKYAKGNKLAANDALEDKAKISAVVQVLYPGGKSKSVKINQSVVNYFIIRFVSLYASYTKVSAGPNFNLLVPFMSDKVTNEVYKDFTEKLTKLKDSEIHQVSINNIEVRDDQKNTVDVFYTVSKYKSGSVDRVIDASRAQANTPTDSIKYRLNVKYEFQLYDAGSFDVMWINPLGFKVLSYSETQLQ